MIFFAEEPRPLTASPQEHTRPEARQATASASAAPAADPQPELFVVPSATAADNLAPEAPAPAAAVLDPPVPERAPAAPVARAAPRPATSETPDDQSVNRAVIKVIGVGGGGGNAVNRMIEAGVTGVDFIAANTDAQVLQLSKAPVRIQLGEKRTGGLGCGGDPEIGRAAARDDIQQLIDVLRGADMVFITVGEGGGTGTGAAPVIACVAQDPEIAALSVAVVTKPMNVEGNRRRNTANDGIRELREFVDTLICVPNDRVVEVYGDLKIRDAFRSADDVVRQAVQGISDLIQVPGEINLDFADIRAAMRQRGDAVMGIGIASGEQRVEEATQAAISSPLLEDTSIQGATSIVVNVTGGENLTLNEVQQAAQVVSDAVRPEGASLYRSTDVGDNILIGTALDPAMDETGEIKVTVVATGFPDRSRVGATPHDFTLVGGAGARAAGSASRAAASNEARPAANAGRGAPEPWPPVAVDAVDEAGASAAAPAPAFAAAAAGGGASAEREHRTAASGARAAQEEPLSLPANERNEWWDDVDTPPFLKHGR